MITLDLLPRYFAIALFACVLLLSSMPLADSQLAASNPLDPAVLQVGSMGMGITLNGSCSQWNRPGVWVYLNRTLRCCPGQMCGYDFSAPGTYNPNARCCGWSNGVCCGDSGCCPNGTICCPDGVTCLPTGSATGCPPVKCSRGCVNGRCVRGDVCICNSGWNGANCSTPMCSQVPSCGHGSCTAPDTCTCNAGWTGPDCNTPVCSTSCGSGSCALPELCVCQADWRGANCSTPVCRQSCGHGACTAPNTCNCSAGWAGPDCNTPICSKCCGVHGSCALPDLCVCEAGWRGANCSTPICSPPCDPSGGSICVAPNTCQCRAGWSGQSCSTPVCSPACLHGSCLGPNQCACADGYGGPTCSYNISRCGWVKTQQEITAWWPHIYARSIEQWYYMCDDGIDLDTFVSISWVNKTDPTIVDPSHGDLPNLQISMQTGVWNGTHRTLYGARAFFEGNTTKIPLQFEQVRSDPSLNLTAKWNMTVVRDSGGYFLASFHFVFVSVWRTLTFDVDVHDPLYWDTNPPICGSVEAFLVGSGSQDIHIPS